MGQGIIVQCENCSDSNEYMIGVGMMYSSLKKVVDFLDYSKKKRVKSILESNEVIDSDYSHELYHCSHCNAITEHFYLRVNYATNQVYETLYICGKCRVNLNKIEIDALLQLPCSKCGGKKLKADENILWD